MSNIEYLVGDATRPLGNDSKIIVHCCNNIGAWGAGFVLAISKKWKEPEDAYLRWHAEGALSLGEVQFVEVEDDIYVANLIGQDGVRTRKNSTPIRYDAIEEGMRKVFGAAKILDASIHMPRMGCGLAGGTWPEILRAIKLAQKETQSSANITVYDFEERED